MFHSHEESSKRFSNEIIIIDGLWGSGKSLLSPLVASMKGVEKPQIYEALDYPLQMRALGRIGEEEASTLTRLGVDIISYNTQIGRNINLRWNDWSGLNINRGGLRYARRIFGLEGDAKMNDLLTNRLALLLMTHYVLPSYQTLLSTFGTRLKYILVIRHPVLAFEHWHHYLSRFNSAREFTLSTEYNNEKVPWFCHRFLPEQIGELGSLERTAAFLIAGYRNLTYYLGKNYLSNRDNRHATIFITSFGRICYQTDRTLEELSRFTGRTYNNCISDILRTEKLPRLSEVQGLGYKSYGHKKFSTISDNELVSNKLQMLGSRLPPTLWSDFCTIMEDYQTISSTILPD